MDFESYQKTVWIFYLWQSLKPKQKLEYVRKMFREPQIMVIWVFRLYDKTDPIMAILRYAYFFDLVTSSMTSWVFNT